MSNNPFPSKEVNLKRVLKGLAITIPCTIMISYLSFYYIDLIDTSLREHYLGEQQDEVLGVEEKVFVQILIFDYPIARTLTSYNILRERRELQYILVNIKS